MLNGLNVLIQHYFLPRFIFFKINFPIKYSSEEIKNLDFLSLI